MTEREIIRRVKAHTGRLVGDWKVSCSIYSSNDKKRPPLEIISFDETKPPLYILVNRTVTEVDPAMVPLLRKISVYQPRLSRSIKGSEYDFIDFIVRVGLVFGKGPQPTGVVVEIEYRPCIIVEDSQALIGELMDKIAAPLVPPPQSSGDPTVSAAATTAYNFKRVIVDADKVNPADMTPFTMRSAAILYAKLLRT